MLVWTTPHSAYKLQLRATHLYVLAHNDQSNPEMGFPSPLLGVFSTVLWNSDQVLGCGEGENMGIERVSELHS